MQSVGQAFSRQLHNRSNYLYKRGFNTEWKSNWQSPMKAINRVAYLIVCLSSKDLTGFEKLRNNVRYLILCTSVCCDCEAQENSTAASGRCHQFSTAQGVHIIIM